MKTLTIFRLLKASFIVLGVLLVGVSFGQGILPGVNTPPPPGGIGEVASNITRNMTAVQYFILGACYLLGLGFSASAIFKFKSHKDNPTQIPIGTPIALGFIGAAFLFIPSMFNMAGHTLFGSTYQTAGPTGSNAQWYTDKK